MTNHSGQLARRVTGLRFGFLGLVLGAIAGALRLPLSLVARTLPPMKEPRSRSRKLSFEGLEIRLTPSLSVTSWINPGNDPSPVVSPTNSPVSSYVNQIGDASAAATAMSLSVEASGGDGLNRESFADAVGHVDFTISGVSTSIKVPLTFYYQFVGYANASTPSPQAKSDFYYANGQYYYWIYYGGTVQTGTYGFISTNGSTTPWGSSNPDAPGTLTGLYPSQGSGELDVDIRAQASSTPGATGNANAVFQVTGVSSPLATANTNIQVQFQNGTTLMVGPSLLASQSLKDNGAADAESGNKQTGDPIDINTGNVYRAVQDYSTSGPNPLDFTRYYNTYTAPNAYSTSLGERWRSTYDRTLQFVSSTQITTIRQTGQVFNFTLTNGVWKSDSDVDYSLVQKGSSWVLTGPDDTVESYSGNSGGSSQLNSITSRDGYTQTLHYNAQGQLVSVKDSFGRSLGFTYQSGLLSSLSMPDGTSITYGYSGTPANIINIAFVGPAVLTSVTYLTDKPSTRRYDYTQFVGLLKDAIDQDGNYEASFTYDRLNRAVEVYEGGSAAINDVRIAYNDTDGSRVVTDANGLNTLYRFAALQGVPKVMEIDREPAGGPVTTIRVAYDANGYEASTTDWNGNVTQYVNNAHGEPTSITEAAGTPQARTTLITYLSVFHLPSLIVAPGETTSFAYDGKGDVLTLTETDTTSQTVPYATAGQTHVWTNTYDAFGHVLVATGPRIYVNQKTTFTYTGDSVSTITDSLGHVTRITSYNPRGLPLSETDPNGVVTSFTYDAMGRELTQSVQTAAGNAVTRNSYDAAGLLISRTQPDGSALSYIYDTAQRLTGEKDPVGESITYTLDGLGNVIRQDTRNAAGVIVATRSSVFNQLEQLIKSIGATTAEVTSYGHDANGNVTSITDPLGLTTYQAFDALNRLVKTTDPLGNVIQDGYNAQDELTSVTNPKGLKTLYFYNGFGQQIGVSSPDSGVTVYYLDLGGDVTSETDARGVVTNFTYDALNRVTGETFPASPAENVAYAYDSTAGGNKGIGHLTSYTDKSGSTSLTYNELGLETAQIQTIGAIAYTTSYAYNLAGNVTQVTYPSGRIVGDGYDSQGRVSSVTTMAGATAPLVTLASGITYEPFGPLASLTYGNGLVMTRSYDGDYRLTGIVTQGGGVTVQNVSFSYDATGNIASQADRLTPANSQTFTYDADNRLKTASGSYGSIIYAYGGDGNRLTSTQDGVTQTYTYATNSDQLLSVSGSPARTFTYLANGDIATDSRSGQAVAYSFDGANQLSQVTVKGSGTESYLYDAIGMRVVTNANGVVTASHYNQDDQLISEGNGTTGVTTREYVWLGSLPLAQIEGNGSIYNGMVDYIHADQTNTPEKMTNAARAVVWDREQQPFGQTTSTTGIAASDLRAPGQIADTLSGLDYNLNRDYDPTLGRYIETDPIGLAGGINDYGYVGQNPVVNVDPLGLCTDCASDSGPSLFDEAINSLRSGLGLIGEGTDWLGGHFDAALNLYFAALTLGESGALTGLNSLVTWDGLKALLADESGIILGRNAASEKSAVNIASQIERDLGVDARNEFHNMKDSVLGDRTLEELKADARTLYEEAGKNLPRWLR